MTFRIFLLIGLLFALSIAGCSQKERSNTEPLQVGETAPDFTLTSSKNEQITLSKANKITVLVFYRGYW